MSDEKLSFQAREPGRSELREDFGTHATLACPCFLFVPYLIAKCCRNAGGLTHCLETLFFKVLRPSASQTKPARLQKLDLYLPAEKSGPAPLVIWIHGGGFRVGDKRSMPRRKFGPAPKPMGADGPYQIQVPDVAALTRKGYAVVSLNYRLVRRPGDAFVAFALPAVQDGKAAVRFLRANAEKYGLDPGKFAVWGNSAGGFIAAMLAVTGDEPTVFDDPAVGGLDSTAAVQAAVVWYGAIEVSSLSLAHYISAAKIVPPILIANGDADSSVPVGDAIRLNDELLKKGIKSSLTILPGAGHEDPAFMATQMLPTFKFLDAAFGR